MSKVFLINVGANTSHQSRAKSPIFENDEFIYVPFPLNNGTKEVKPWPSTAVPFYKDVGEFQTHSDPDWKNLTYGDYWGNARASALKNAKPGDILLFWALLWHNKGQKWDDFTGKKGWYLIGALRIDEIVKENQHIDTVTPQNKARASQNTHFKQKNLGAKNIVFIGQEKYSGLFSKAVDFVTDKSDLLFRTVKTAGGDEIKPNGSVRWSSSTRACRVIWDLSKPEQLSRAMIARNEVINKSRFDLFIDL